jgi:choline dehydrogenase
LKAREFDYIVIGGGSAGSAVAGRLSEDRNRQLCLPEAGPRYNDFRVKVPLGVMMLMGNPDFDWCRRSAPHAHPGGREVAAARYRRRPRARAGTIRAH